MKRVKLWTPRRAGSGCVAIIGTVTLGALLASHPASAQPARASCGGEIAGIDVEAQCSANFALDAETPLTLMLEPGPTYTGYLSARACDRVRCAWIDAHYVAGLPDYFERSEAVLQPGEWTLTVHGWSGSRWVGTPGVPGRCVTVLYLGGVCTPSIPPTSWRVPLPGYGAFAASVN
jgi:hypothetical protein